MDGHTRNWGDRRTVQVATPHGVFEGGNYAVQLVLDLDSYSDMDAGEMSVQVCGMAGRLHAGTCSVHIIQHDPYAPGAHLHVEIEPAPGSLIVIQSWGGHWPLVMRAEEFVGALLEPLGWLGLLPIEAYSSLLGTHREAKERALAAVLKESK